MLSIITITFNNYEDLIKTYESLKPVDITFEHIVINGGNCEKTLNFLESEFKGLHISEPDRGISDAFNKGVKLAKGEYICFVNSGDKVIDPSYFNNVKPYLESGIDMVCCDNIVFFEGVGEKLKKSILKFPNMPFAHQGMILKKSIIESVGYFDSSYKTSMDYNLICKVYALKIPKFYYYEKAVVLMDGSGVSHTSNDLGELEKLRSLKETGLLTGNYRFQLYYQFLKAKIKKILILVKLESVVLFYKKYLS